MMLMPKSNVNTRKLSRTLLGAQKQLDREAEEVEHQIAELSRLETLIQLYEEQEKYQKAAIILRKYNNLKTRLIKKGVIE